MTSQTYTRAAIDGLLAGITKASIGLGNVDNTADATKPVSAAQQTAIIAAVASYVAGAPGALDTLNELAAALGNDQNFAATVTAALADRPTAAALAATYVALRGAFATGTAYPKNSLVIQAGAVYLAAADVPSRTSFTAGDWQALGGGGVTTPALTNTAAPAISGTAQTGQTLTASNGTWSATPDSYTRQWRRAGAAIAGATAQTYLLVTADVGQVIDCLVTASKSGYSSGSAATGTVTPTAPSGGGTVVVTDNGDGTYSASGITITDNGDGTFSSTGSVTDNGDGTFALAA